MLGGALVFSRGSKSERHLRKKINPAVTHSAVADPANSRHLKKSLEARHLPGEVGTNTPHLEIPFTLRETKLIGATILYRGRRVLVRSTVP